MNTTNFPAILRQCGTDMGFDGLCLDEDNSCTLMIHEAVITMLWFKATDSLLLYASLGDVPQGLESELLYKALLELDMRSRGRLCVSGMDLNTRLVTLGAALPGYALTPASLRGYLDMFGQEAVAKKKLFTELLEAHSPWDESAEPVRDTTLRI